MKTTNHPLRNQEEDEDHQDRDQDKHQELSPTSSTDITRPTLKRITADHSHSHSQSKTRHSPSNSINQIWCSKKTHQAHSPLNQSPTNQTPLAHNPIRFKPHSNVLIHTVDHNQTLPGIALSYGISLSALRKANRMWASDPLNIKTTLRIPLELCNLPPSKKIEIEEHSGKVLLFEPNSGSSQSECSSTNQSDQPFSSNSKRQTTIDSDSSQSLLDFDYPNGFTNQSSSDSFQYPQLGQLAPISNSKSPPPSTQPDALITVASFQKPLDFSTLESIQPHRLPSSSSSLQQSHIIPDASQISSSTIHLRSSSNNLRQRPRKLSFDDPQLSTPHRSISSPSPSSSRTPTARPTRIPSHSLQNHSPQLSPDSKKKRNPPPNFNFFSSNKISSLSPYLHSNLVNLLGNEEEETETGGRSMTKSKWTTVRPGKPPPLGQAFQFLEEPATLSSNKIGQAVSNALEGIFNSSTASHPNRETERRRAEGSQTARGIESLEIDDFDPCDRRGPARQSHPSAPARRHASALHHTLHPPDQHLPAHLQSSASCLPPPPPSSSSIWNLCHQPIRHPISSPSPSSPNRPFSANHS